MQSLCYNVVGSGEKWEYPTMRVVPPLQGVKMVTIIRDTDLTRVPGSVKPDTKKRIVLPNVLVQEDMIYHMYYNSAGQILLDPQVTIPASELWLFENRDALNSVDRGMLESLSGKAIKRGSFAKYVKDAP